MKTNRIFNLSAVLICAAFALSACGGGGSGGSAHVHQWGEWTVAEAPTCEEEGTEKRTCALDPTHVETRSVAALDHQWSTAWAQDENGHYHVCERGCGSRKDEAAHTYSAGACSACGYIHHDHEYESGVCNVCGSRLYTESEDGAKICFGEYPQSEVKEEAVVSALTEKAGSLPEEGNAGGWTSYGYYYGGEVTDYMWYIDVELNGSKYRGVYFTLERNSRTGVDYLSYQEENGYLTNTVYWFRFEPIEWRVLERVDGTVLLMADIILDGGHFYRDGESRTKDDETIYPNNYMESDIRKWLIENFYETAFSNAAKQIIETTTVDNHTAGSDNPYLCEDTRDKVFLLSSAEVENQSYGFVTSSSADATRQLKATDYAKAQGIQPQEGTDCFSWWLRTPEKQAKGKTVFRVSEKGQVQGGAFWMGGGEYVDFTRNGIVPALRLHL